MHKGVAGASDRDRALGRLYVIEHVQTAPMPGDESLAASEGAAALASLFAGRRVAVLTGAGCSTESGIPDYRGPETRRRAKNPVEYREFVGNAAARQRYWARALFGWETIQNARPNPAHRAIAELEAAGVVSGVVTQNVD